MYFQFTRPTEWSKMKALSRFSIRLVISHTQLCLSQIVMERSQVLASLSDQLISLVSVAVSQVSLRGVRAIPEIRSRHGTVRTSVALQPLRRRPNPACLREGCTESRFYFGTAL